MKTNFTLRQLRDSGTSQANDILRRCIHCGFCTATCPTYQLLGDELDSPRGRIYLIKEMLEKEKVPDEKTVLHIDRCLSCLACMTTCPSGVHYMHLVDHARTYIEKTYTRPLPERLLRRLLAFVLPNPKIFRLSLYGAMLGRPFKALMPGRLKGLLAMAPKTIPSSSQVDRPQTFPAQGKRKMRVALMNGCAQRVLDPKINEATIRLLTRHGVEVVVAKGSGCCGALTHHMGMEKNSHNSAAANIHAWRDEMDGEGLDRIVINTSGCGTTVKDYGYMFRDDNTLAKDAETVSGMARDITELMSELNLQPTGKVPKLKIAYHSACSMQHGQKITTLPYELLKTAGFEVVTIPESHLCCGSAGTYNLLQPELATKLRDRKVENIRSVSPQLIAAGNLGCMIQIGGAIDVPVVHTVELLDWATGGPKPKSLDAIGD
ncbi:MAG: glycolate oxidase subunit GlcF [Rhizobiaceae bacterium]|nr:glycolate oxidase subunit GlcF [Rhizobiaceae bacterium]